MSEEIENKNWSEWFDWLKVNIYDEIYDVVPCGSWEEIEIELKCKDGSIRKASMFPNEEYTDDDYWKSYELLGEHDWNCKTDDVVEWRYLNDWQD